jgi:Fic family protein
MKKEDFQRHAPGTLVKASGRHGDFWAFVPNPLPPKLTLPPETQLLLEKSVLILGRLDGVGSMLPNPHMLIRPLLRREAVSSSRIEGTVTSYEQLLLFEADPSDDTMHDDRQEVENYVVALETGLECLKSQPVTMQLVRNLHTLLMAGARGADKKPGEYRDGQNMIARQGEGNPAHARFVPPPPLQMRDCLEGLERFIQQPSSFSILIDLALIHYQFESIHPFWDGNGRMGRLLIILLLCQRGYLARPLLYLSDYFERHKEQYIDHLLRVSRDGDWIGWINFFLRATECQSKASVKRCNELLALQKAYRERFRGAGYSDRSSFRESRSDDLGYGEGAGGLVPDRPEKHRPASGGGGAGGGHESSQEPHLCRAGGVEGI